MALIFNEEIYMTYNTYRSRLIPYENEIVALRRKRPPVPFSKIAEYLREKYQVSVHRQTILDFLKVRAKGYKTCKYAWDVEPVEADNPSTTIVPSLRNNPSIQPQKPSTQDKPEPTAQPVDSTKPRRFEMPFSETYNLTRVSPEEAAVRLKKLEEKEKQR